MRILSIRLADVRRFSAPVEVAGIGAGLNLLSAPNESGKSTLFDALHAVFFLPHRSQAKEARSLRALVDGQPTGGAPEAAVVVEVAEGRFELRKRWFSRPLAEVRRLDGPAPGLVAKADEAEAWIARLAGGEGKGPAGLLWVRQGETGLGDDPGLRRDLLSSVTGEVEAMTGGRRMDRARARASAELERLATGTGRPKAGGPWKAAVDEAEALAGEVARLEADVGRLHAGLERRRAVRRELAELREPAAEAARKAALEAAEAALAAAQRHAERLRAAGAAATMAALTLKESEGRLARLRQARAEAEEAGAAATAAAMRRAEAGRARAAAAEALAGARARSDAAEAARGEADRALLRAHAAVAAQEGARRRAELREAVTRAEALRREVEAKAAAAAQGPDAKALRRLEDLARDLRARREALAREAPAISVRYAEGGEGGAAVDGVPLQDGARLSIPGGAVVELRGLGRLVVEPGRGGGDAEAVATAERALAGALAALGQATLEAAQAAHDRREAAEAARREAQAKLEAAAPGGVAALLAALEALPDPAAEGEPAPPLPEAQAGAEAARQAAASAARAAETAGRDASAAEAAEARATAEDEAAAARLARARAAACTEGEADEAALGARIVEERAALEAAEAARARLAEAAPDLAAAEAALARAQGAARNAAEARERLEREEIGLTATIDVQAGAAVEEELEAARERLDRAQEAAARLGFEVQVLTRLVGALDAARSAARDRWFAPVMTELRPLLALLWEEAELRWDEAEVAPEALVRRGAGEAFGILSGGTQEQLAVLVRLAFARMLAAGGRPAPVILDDALVHTDDERIARMFNALHRQARDMQIIVLSCRQRAFRDLGARELDFAPAPPRAED